MGIEVQRFKVQRFPTRLSGYAGQAGFHLYKLTGSLNSSFSIRHSVTVDLGMAIQVLSFICNSDVIEFISSEV